MREKGQRIRETNRCIRRKKETNEEMKGNGRKREEMGGGKVGNMT